MSPKRSGLQRPPGFLIEPGGGGQSRLRVPLVPQKKDPRAGGRVCPREPRSPPTVPRGSLEAEAVPVLRPPKSTPRGAPSPRPPRRPRRGARAASRCRCSPAGRSREPRAGPGCLSVFLARLAHRPPWAPERALPPGLSLAHLARSAATLAGLGERKQRGVCWGETRNPDGSIWKPPASLLPLLFRCCGQRPGLGAS